MTNTSPVLCPTRSKEAALGTNPISLAAPAKNGDGLVLGKFINDKLNNSNLNFSGLLTKFLIQFKETNMNLSLKLSET